jgi:hypothetical protein
MPSGRGQNQRRCGVRSEGADAGPSGLGDLLPRVVRKAVLWNPRGMPMATSDPSPHSENARLAALVCWPREHARVILAILWVFTLALPR